MSRNKKGGKQKTRDSNINTKVDNQKKQEIFKTIAFLVDYISGRHIENVKKTKDIIQKLLEPTKLEAQEKTLKYNSTELDKRDLYCLEELNKQIVYEYYGQHQKLLSNAILIATYNTLEHLLSTVSNYIERHINIDSSKPLYLRRSLKVMTKLDFKFDNELLEKIDTLRKVRNVLVHANGECMNRFRDDIESILKATAYISKDQFERLDIRAEYLDESLDCIDRIVSSLKDQVDVQILMKNQIPAQTSELL